MPIALLAIMLTLPVSLLAGEAPPAEKDEISKDIERLATGDAAAREEAKARLKALPGDQAVRLVREAAKAEDPGLKANIEYCARHVFNTHLVKAFNVYKLATSNLGLAFFGASVSTYDPSGDGNFMYCLVVGKVDKSSAFADSVLAGDIILEVRGQDGSLKKLPYEPVDTAEAAISLFGPLVGQEITLVIFRQGKGKVEAKANLRGLAPEEMTEEVKTGVDAIVDTLWNIFRTAAGGMPEK